jgi:hypothetical protein
VVVVGAEAGPRGDGDVEVPLDGCSGGRRLAAMEGKERVECGGHHRRQKWAVEATVDQATMKCGGEDLCSMTVSWREEAGS